MADDAVIPPTAAQSTVQPEAPASQTPSATETAGATQATSASSLLTNDVASGTAATDAKTADSGSAAPVAKANPATPLTPKTAPNTIRLNTIVGGVTQQNEVSLAPKATVLQALKAIGITLGRYDRTWPAGNTPVYDGLTMRVTRVQVIDKNKRRETVQPVLRYKPTTAIARGSQKLLQKGQPGIVEISERQWIVDGKPATRKTERHVMQPLKDKIIGLGARSVYIPGKTPYHRRYARAYALSSRSGSPRDRMAGAAPAMKGTSDATALRPVRSIMIATSAYVVGHCGSPYMRTATGLPATYGAVAVDPRVIPLGTKMYIEGYGYAFACDTGGAIKGNRVDLAMDSLKAAFRHGRRKQRAWILEP